MQPHSSCLLVFLPLVDVLELRYGVYSSYCTVAQMNVRYGTGTTVRYWKYRTLLELPRATGTAVCIETTATYGKLQQCVTCYVSLRYATDPTVRYGTLAGAAPNASVRVGAGRVSAPSRVYGRFCLGRSEEEGERTGGHHGRCHRGSPQTSGKAHTDRHVSECACTARSTRRVGTVTELFFSLVCQRSVFYLFRIILPHYIHSVV